MTTEEQAVTLVNEAFRGEGLVDYRAKLDHSGGVAILRGRLRIGPSFALETPRQMVDYALQLVRQQRQARRK